MVKGKKKIKETIEHKSLRIIKNSRKYMDIIQSAVTYSTNTKRLQTIRDKR